MGQTLAPRSVHVAAGITVIEHAQNAAESPAGRKHKTAEVHRVHGRVPKEGSSSESSKRHVGLADWQSALVWHVLNSYWMTLHEHCFVDSSQPNFETVAREATLGHSAHAMTVLDPAEVEQKSEAEQDRLAESPKNVRYVDQHLVATMRGGLGRFRIS